MKAGTDEINLRMDDCLSVMTGNERDEMICDGDDRCMRYLMESPFGRRLSSLFCRDGIHAIQRPYSASI